MHVLMAVKVFYGDDTYSIGRAVEQVKRNGAFGDIDVSRIDARAVSARQLLMTIGTPGLFSAQRLVIVDGVGQAKDGRASRSKAKQQGDAPVSVDDLLGAASDSTTVVAIAPGRSDSGWIKEAIALGRAGKLEAKGFPAPRQRDMPGWIAKQASESGVRIEGRAVQQLAVRVGEQFSIAGIELEKLSAAAGPSAVIDVEMVRALVPQSAEESIFPLIDAIANGKHGQVFQLLERQMMQLSGSETELALRLIRLLARQFRILLSIRLLRSEGLKRPEIVAELKIPDYFQDRYFAQAAQLPEPWLRGAFERLAATEQAMKNGEAGGAELHLLLADLARVGEAASEKGRK
ncbi:MAG TPA: DNA polymerase III subunit delta [Chloroflexota bacterium]|nr:DNA polymerase III subunit delta [Chloroflexota bacterium]